MHSDIIAGNSEMMVEGASAAAIDPSFSVTEMLSLVGWDIVYYVTWSGILGILTPLLARAIAHVTSIACVDSFGFLKRAA